MFLLFYVLGPVPRKWLIFQYFCVCQFSSSRQIVKNNGQFCNPTFHVDLSNDPDQIVNPSRPDPGRREKLNF